MGDDGTHYRVGSDGHFLNEMIRAGDCFVLSVNPRLVRPGTWLFRELVYLRAGGHRIPRAPAWTQ